MSLADPLPIMPFTRPVRGSASLPGSKSITNRALILAALSGTPVTLTGALFSEDTRLMAEALARLGFTLSSDEAGATMQVSGQARACSGGTQELFVGLAGTAARFLTALCAAAPRGIYRLDGVPQMRRRPMRSLIAGLRTLGADIRCLGEEGFFPFEIRARGLHGGSVALDASESSQLLSALLMVAPRASGPVDVVLTGSVRRGYVEMTRRLMTGFGVTMEGGADGRSFHLVPAAYRAPTSYVIEPDASAASYFLALPKVTGGTLDLTGLRAPDDSLQGDTAFSAALARAVRRSPGATFDENFHEISDTFLTLAAIAPLLPGPTRITGIAHTRKQETDRVAGMAHELTKLGQHVIEEPDALEVHPRPLRPGQVIETYHDHRFAMSFGILGCHDLHGNGQPWLSIKDPGCCAKTFPHFFELLESLREKSLEN